MCAALCCLLGAGAPAQEHTAPGEQPFEYQSAPDPRPAPSDDVSWSIAEEDPCPYCDGECWCENGGAWGQGGMLSATFAHLCEMSSRSTATHGRAVGRGRPLRGTSWLNRPYEVAVDVGAFVMAGRPTTGVRGANDVFVALQAGADWDNYWGTQARIGWTTPDLNTAASGGGESDNLFLTDLSLMYYPWGDSQLRPYWRAGLGLTDIEFTNINGLRQQEYLFTMPFGLGIKHQTRRWLVWRAE
ncbi:MAG: hypothetical protein KDA37_04200, partial [Planctomycetales bacterium]|nr:hypothetical protein [Planctomycetales bacterium]